MTKLSGPLASAVDSESAAREAARSLTAFLCGCSGSVPSEIRAFMQFLTDCVAGRKIADYNRSEEPAFVVVLVKGALVVVIAAIGAPIAKDAVPDGVVADLIREEVGDADFQSVSTLGDMDGPTEGTEESGAEVGSVESHGGAPFHLAEVEKSVSLRRRVEFDAIKRLAAEGLSEDGAPVA